MKRVIKWPKYVKIVLERKLMSTVNYLYFINFIRGAIKQSEEL